MAADQSVTCDFFNRLLEAVPEFKAVYEDIVEYDEGEILHTLILAALARFVLKSATDALADPAKSGDADSSCRRTMSFLEQELESRYPEIKDWIYTGFLEGLLQEDERAVERVVTFFGQNLKHAWTTHFQE